MLTHVEVAANLFHALHPTEAPPSNQRIQALCILAQRHHYRLYQQPLFGDAIIQTGSGPLIPNLLERAMAMFGERNTLIKPQMTPYPVLIHRHGQAIIRVPPAPAVFSYEYITIDQVMRASRGVSDNLLMQSLHHPNSRYHDTPEGHIISIKQLAETSLIPTNTPTH